ncbi:hypothetical protein QTP88_021641 [Uroleucon formosanum]
MEKTSMYFTNYFCIALTKGEEYNMLTVECVNNPYNQLINHIPRNQMSTVPDPEINFIKSHFEVSSSMLENHNRLQVMCNKHDKFANNMKTQDQINKLKTEEELKYYKIEETLKSYDCQLNELIERNMTRESQLHTIIGNLLDEIEQSHNQYRIKLSEKNKQIRNYLDQIETILDNFYKFKSNNTKI